MPSLGTESLTVQHPLTRYAGQAGWAIARREQASILQTLDGKITIHERRCAALSDLFQTILHQLMTAQIRVRNLDIDTSEVEPT